MSRTVRDANLETRAARRKLAVRGKPYYRLIHRGCHLGYRKGRLGGRWLVRLDTGTGAYRLETFATADDVSDTNGSTILTFREAQERAREIAADQTRNGETEFGKYTVRTAMIDYLAWAEKNSRGVRTTRSAIERFILPELGDKRVNSLTTRQIEDWHQALADAPARVRSGRGRPPKYRARSGDPDEARRRRATANRTLTVLKAGLNRAWHRRNDVPSDTAWRAVVPFPNVDAPRIRYLTKAECVRLVNACEPDFRPMVQAALLTGCRYGELAAMEVGAFNPDTGRVHVARSKNGKDRHVALTDDGRRFFEARTAARPSGEPMFSRSGGKPWGPSHQLRRMSEACKRANISPPISFHILRHCYGSHLAMAGIPLPVIARNMGHADTRMTEKHYAHLAPSYVSEMIRTTAPTLGVVEPGNVVRLEQRAQDVIRR